MRNPAGAGNVLPMLGGQFVKLQIHQRDHVAQSCAGYGYCVGVFLAIGQHEKYAHFQSAGLARPVTFGDCVTAVRANCVVDRAGHGRPRSVLEYA